MNSEPTAYSRYSLPAHEVARPVAVEDADGDDRREPVEGVEPGRLDVVAGHQDRPADRLHERRRLGDADHDPQRPAPQPTEAVGRQRPRAGQRVGHDEHPRRRRGASSSVALASSGDGHAVLSGSACRPRGRRCTRTIPSGDVSTTVIDVLSRLRITTPVVAGARADHRVDRDEVGRDDGVGAQRGDVRRPPRRGSRGTWRRALSTSRPWRPATTAPACPSSTPSGDGISATSGSTSAVTDHRAASGAAVSRHRRNGLVTRRSGASAPSGAEARRRAAQPGRRRARRGRGPGRRPSRPRPGRGARGGRSPSDGLQQPVAVQPGPGARLDVPLGAEHGGEDLLEASPASSRCR